MNSATSIEDPALHRPAQSPRGGDRLQPWQFFLLAGMLSATAVVLVSSGQSAASIIVLSLTVVSASFVALGVYRSLAPLVTPEGAEPPPLIVGQTRAALEREKTLTLRAIKDLEFDYAMKKIAKSDFDEVSTRLRARAMGLMRQLDSGGGYKDAIEAELRQRLGAGATGDASAVHGRPDAPLALASDSLCACGTQNDPDARFCKNCGSKLSAA